MPSLYWPWSKKEHEIDTKPEPEPEPEPNWSFIPEPVTNVASTLQDSVAALPPHLIALSAFLLGSASSFAAIRGYTAFFKRIPNAEWVTPDMIAKRRWIKGYVTSVGDADNFRIYHTPGLGWRWPLKFRHIPSAAKDLKDKTIHIRIAGVDAPEAAHFGRPAQEFSEEALAWLKKYVAGKTVYCQLARKDQYGRIVALPHLKPRFLPASIFPGKCIPLEMLRAGWVETYEQSGAEYGRWGKDAFLRIQSEAQMARRGIWKYGLTRESAADYKRRYSAQGFAEDPKDSTPAASPDTQKSGWFRRLLGWKS